MRNYLGGRSLTKKSSPVVIRYGRSREKVRGKILRTEQKCKVSTPCLGDHNFKKEELEAVGELSKVCSWS